MDSEQRGIDHLYYSHSRFTFQFSGPCFLEFYLPSLTRVICLEACKTWINPLAAEFPGTHEQCHKIYATNCDQIFKKGSYTHTTSAHRCVHVLWPTVHQSAVPEGAF